MPQYLTYNKKIHYFSLVILTERSLYSHSVSVFHSYILKFTSPPPQALTHLPH